MNTTFPASSADRERPAAALGTLRPQGGHGTAESHRVLAILRAREVLAARGRLDDLSIRLAHDALGNPCAAMSADDAALAVTVAQAGPELAQALLDADRDAAAAVEIATRASADRDAAETCARRSAGRYIASDHLALHGAVKTWAAARQASDDHVRKHRVTTDEIARAVYAAEKGMLNALAELEARD